MAITLIGGGGGGLDPEYVWLDAYKAYGENSYAFNDKDIYDAMMRHKCAAMDLDVRFAAWDYICSTDHGVGAFLTNCITMSALDKATIKSLDTLADVANNATSISVLTDDDLGIQLVADNTYLFGQFISKSAYLSQFVNDRSAITLACKNAQRFALMDDEGTIQSALRNSTLITMAERTASGTAALYGVSVEFGDAEKSALVVETSSDQSQSGAKSAIEKIEYYTKVFPSSSGTHFAPGLGGEHKMCVVKPGSTMTNKPYCYFKGDDNKTSLYCKFYYIALDSYVE